MIGVCILSMEDISFTSKFPQILVTLEFNNKVPTSIV